MAAITAKVTTPRPAPSLISPARTAGGRRDQEPLDVEAEDRPPGRVPLVDHPLPGLQVHGRSLAAPPVVRLA